eukprot:Hpha_TRINITY_DN15135_c1_g1::TRINITY_DN15135_c1_g1_i1::g.128227::m.128227
MLRLWRWGHVAASTRLVVSRRWKTKKATKRVGAPGQDDASRELHASLKKYFGFEQFREHQEECISAVLKGRDAAAFWATGSGKSLCYQLPPLHTGKTAFVVTPLISLMQDQVTKLNATVGQGVDEIACFLGSSQSSRQVERDAFSGKYRLVYLTPEYFVGAANPAIQLLANHGEISLIAVDEAHCVSQWGYDFRPEFMQIGDMRPEGVPILALTATAVPRCRADVIEQLRMKEPVRYVTSFDRPNLQLNCVRKRGTNFDLNFLTSEIRAEKKKGEVGSTLVYVPTRADAERITDALSDATGLECLTYHGGMALPERQHTHLEFLTGDIRLVVATIAFGMGIDKPDIRRVVHLGAPKTFEEYIQQIGRAGRDGLPSKCYFVATDSDFTRFFSDFYTGKLPETAKESVLKSTEALRRFHSDPTACRRRLLLEFLGESPTFGDRCGECDNCRTVQSLQEKGEDLHRNLRALAKPVMMLVAKGPCTWTTIQKVLFSGGLPPRMIAPAIAAQARELFDALPAIQRSPIVIKDILAALTDSDTPLLARRKSMMKSRSGRGFSAYEEFLITQDGVNILETEGAPIILAVPHSLHQAEDQSQSARKRLMDELSARGVDVGKVPAAELADGDGPTLTVALKWARSLSALTPNMVKRLEGLLNELTVWRDAAAHLHGTAPGSLLPDHMLKRIALARPTSMAVLSEVGVRVSKAEEIIEIVAKHFPSQNEQSQPEDRLKLPEGMWKAEEQWVHAKPWRVFKSGKVSSAEESYRRWTNGEDVEVIAMSRDDGGLIQVHTVVSHIWQALLLGQPVDLSRIPSRYIPSKSQWVALDIAATAIDLDNEGARDKDRDRFLARDLVLKVAGSPEAFDEISVEERSRWYDAARGYMVLKRARVPVEIA